MFGSRRKKSAKRRPVQPCVVIEMMEARQLLSAAVDATMHSNAVYLHSSAATSTSSIQGYTPAQIRTAYDFSQITFPSGTSADGAGQTIAIVDAYNDPNITSDLSVFDTQFGLSAPPSLKIVNQSGGSSLPTTDSGWAGEISLDVEWAHAMAPKANILLVEAGSADVTSLMASVKYAASAPGVSVVSMSWGGSEFFSWGGGEFASQTAYDSYFTTPAGHQGVTFIAAAGDSGVQGGVDWPASSPNVLSVGGTTLNTQNASGTYSSESSWSGTSGGFSQIESQPAYQKNAITSATRAVPDVSYNADPNTGFAVYDSLPDQGYSGWQVVGGTSAGAPQWAALIAIADQGRVISGMGTLDGATQTLPMLYNLYSAPSTSGYSAYTSAFNDVIDTGSSNPWHWRWGRGSSGSQAVAGYDAITGLGTPHAANVVTALTSTSSTGSTTGSGSNSGSSGSNGSSSGPAPQALPASPITGTFVTSTPVSVVGGSSGYLKIRLTNTAATKFTGPLTITLYASTDNAVSSDDTAVTSLTLSKVTLKAGGSKTVKLKFNYPTTVADGSYFFVASVDATTTNTTPATAATAATVAIAAPNVDLSATFAGGQGVKVTPGKGGSATITIQNLGNVTASGTLGLSLYASSGTILDSSAQLLASLATRTIHLRAGRSMTLHVHFVAPADQAAGTYNLLGAISSSTQPADGNSSNDVAVTGTLA
ncbi:MAG: peptidase and in kexin sedolisin [Phycisphaerales bacterium]|nr:peptidase and in kexin sedolisin [Phycisphaerales bacterium]